MRDDLSWAARTRFTTAGPQSGHTSWDFSFKWNQVGTPSTSDLNSLATDVAGFCINTAGGFKTSHWLGPQVSRGTNSAEVALYSLDLDDPEHYYGSPRTLLTFTPDSGVASPVPLPNEVAIVLSYRAGYGTDPEHGGTTRPRSSDRGRIYFGPLETSAINNVTIVSGLHLAQPHPNVTDNLLAAFTNLQVAAQTHHFDLSVWSREHKILKPVQWKAVNAEFDTMRKREIAIGLLSWVSI